MNRTEAMKIVAMIETNWQPVKDQEASYDLWAAAFKDDPFEMVETAVMALVQTDLGEFRPTVAKVRKMMRDILYGRPMTETEAWLAVKNSFHEAQEGSETLRGARSAWKKLPEDIQKIVTPKQLRDWNGIETEQLDTVIQSNFMRSYRELRNNRFTKEAMSKSLLETIEKIQAASPVFENNDEKHEELPAPKLTYEKPDFEIRREQLAAEEKAKAARFAGKTFDNTEDDEVVWEI